MSAPCSFAGCFDVVEGYSLCKFHNRLRRQGKPLVERRPPGRQEYDRWRFLRMVTPEPNTGCWLWAGLLNADGYGWFRLRGRAVGAHRAAFEFHVGAIPADMVVMHRCDVRWCVNPDHLRLGSQRDNIADMVAKGRKAVMTGDRNPNSVLNSALVTELRRRWSEGEAIRALARSLGLNRRTVGRAVRGLSWGVIP